MYTPQNAVYTVPENFPKDVTELLSHIFVIDPEQRYSVEETEGAKNQSYKTLIKFIEPLKEVVAKIEANDSNDEDFLKEQAEIKDMTEFIQAKEHIKETDEIIQLEGAANA